MIDKAFLHTCTFSFAVLALAATGEAQDYSYDNGYIRSSDGDVSLQRAQNPEPEPGDINVPVLPGDRVWTSGSSFAEIRLADGTQVRLGEHTKVDFMGFGAEPNVRLWNGSVVVILGESARVRIDTPSGSVFQQSPGSHRVDVRDGRTTTVTVIEGFAELASEKNSVVIDNGYRSVLETGAEPADPFSFEAAGEDGLDTWSRKQDREEARRREVPLAELSGEVHHYVDDLDDHGSWYEHEEHGSVWVPTVSSSWAPYRDGRWSYTSYGYTWVSHEPWGWAPYHYGRWGYNYRGWYWVPGAHWSPAWVSFAVGPAWIGWSPLGYHGGSVFAYDHAYYGAGRYPQRNGRRHYRGGKAVPRHVYDNGAGWNFSGKEHFRRGGRARLRAADVRSSSARARVANQAAVLDRDLMPRGIDNVRARAPRPLPFAARTSSRTTVGRTRAGVAPRSAETSTLRPARDAHVSTSIDRNARARQRNSTRTDRTATTGRSAPNGGAVAAEPRSGSRVFRSHGATRTPGAQAPVPTGTRSVRRRNTPSGTLAVPTTPQRSGRSRSRTQGTQAQPRTDGRTRGQDYFEGSTRRKSVTRSRPQGTSGARRSTKSPERTSTPNRTRSQNSNRATTPRGQRSSNQSGVSSSTPSSRNRSSKVNRSTGRSQTRSSGVGRSRGSGRSSSGRARSGGTGSRGAQRGGARGRNR